ncbi:hypothetical protein [Neisseria sp. Ec49-e6-T10]|uniref:hypothetical protein n=1 Tax=Neisseria sp. Ec49-e6-T10 TaxID=3140744 RepID=UPI003EBC5409
MTFDHKTQVQLFKSKIQAHCEALIQIFNHLEKINICLKGCSNQSSVSDFSGLLLFADDYSLKKHAVIHSTHTAQIFLEDEILNMIHSLSEAMTQPKPSSTVIHHSQVFGFNHYFELLQYAFNHMCQTGLYFTTIDLQKNIGVEELSKKLSRAFLFGPAYILEHQIPVYRDFDEKILESLPKTMVEHLHEGVMKKNVK